MSKKSILLVIPALIAIGVTVALLQQGNRTPQDGGAVPSNQTNSPPKETVNVVSARSAFPFLQRWVTQYNNDENAVGNAELLYYLEKPDMPGDLVIIGDIRDAATGTLNIPISAQAVAIVYNIPSLPDISSGMKLNSSLLSSILDGNITLWNDVNIKDLNPDLNLPSEKIIVVHEMGNSSSMGLLRNYMSSDIRWQNDSIDVQGPDEVASTVRKTPYSIGYVDFSYATQTRMTFAAVANPAGNYVLPSTDSIFQAINSSMQVQNVTDVNQSNNLLVPPFTNTSKFGNSSYPITGTYYASLPDTLSGKSRNATLDFVRWMIDASKGQQILTEVQYPPIYQDNKLLSEYASTAINSTMPRVSKT